MILKYPKYTSQAGVAMSLPPLGRHTEKNTLYRWGQVVILSGYQRVHGGGAIDNGNRSESEAMSTPSLKLQHQG